MKVSWESTDQETNGRDVQSLGDTNTKSKISFRLKFQEPQETLIRGP